MSDNETESSREYRKKAEAYREKLHKKRLEKIMTDGIKEEFKELDRRNKMIEREKQKASEPPEKQKASEPPEKQKASEPPDERPPQLNPAREMKPLPINYIPYKRIQEVRSGENSRAYLGSNAMSLKKPLAPNVLDIAAMEREKELAAQRRKAGHKWVQVMIR